MLGTSADCQATCWEEQTADSRRLLLALGPTLFTREVELHFFPLPYLPSQDEDLTRHLSQNTGQYSFLNPAASHDWDIADIKDTSCGDSLCQAKSLGEADRHRELGPSLGTLWHGFPRGNSPPPAYSPHTAQR